MYVIHILYLCKRNKEKMFGNYRVKRYVCNAKQSDELYHPVEHG